jgi:hypothetical protein
MTCQIKEQASLAQMMTQDLKKVRIAIRLLKGEEEGLLKGLLMMLKHLIRLLKGVEVDLRR